MGPFQTLGLQYRIGVCTPAGYMYTCTINGGDLSAVDIVYGCKVKAMFFLGSNTINQNLSITKTKYLEIYLYLHI